MQTLIKAYLQCCGLGLDEVSYTLRAGGTREDIIKAKLKNVHKTCELCNSGGATAQGYCA